MLVVDEYSIYSFSSMWKKMEATTIINEGFFYSKSFCSSLILLWMHKEVEKGF